MPRLNWLGRDAVVNHHYDVPFHFLDRKYGTGENMIIHGDNLLALKSLLPKFEQKIKCIYIDPPYNTGNEGWVYNDNVSDPQLQKWLGEVVGREGEDFTRHDKWLCMMYPRLRLLQRLLSDDGVIFISIDDNEQANLKLICNEIFGERNFIAMFTWIKKKKGSHLSKTVRNMTEYVFCYAKDKARVELYGEAAYADKKQPLAKRTNRRKTLTFPPRTIETTLGDGEYEGVHGTGTSALTFEKFIVESGLVVSQCRVNGPFVWTQTKLDEELALGTKPFLSTQFGFNVLRADQATKIKRPSTLLDSSLGIGTNEDAYDECKRIFEREGVMTYPKPSTLIRYLIDAVTHFDSSSFILDAFGGSGTTAHAVINLNRADGGNRKFILIESQPYAETIIAERVRRVDPEYDFGFYEIGARLFLDNGMLNPDVPIEQLREYVYFSETRQPLPSSDRQYLLGIHDGRAIYFLYDPDRELAINDEFVFSTLNDGAESRVIYAERTFCGERFLSRYNTTFKRIAADILRM